METQVAPAQPECQPAPQAARFDRRAWNRENMRRRRAQENRPLCGFCFRSRSTTEVERLEIDEHTGGFKTVTVNWCEKC